MKHILQSKTDDLRHYRKAHVKSLNKSFSIVIAAMILIVSGCNNNEDKDEFIILTPNIQIDHCSIFVHHNLHRLICLFH